MKGLPFEDVVVPAYQIYFEARLQNGKVMEFTNVLLRSLWAWSCSNINARPVYVSDYKLPEAFSIPRENKAYMAKRTRHFYNIIKDVEYVKPDKNQA